MHIMLMSHCSNMHFSSDLNISSSSRDQTPNSCELPINYRPNLSTESLERKLSTTESEDSFIQFCTDDNGDHGSSDSSVFDSDYSEDDLDCGNINSALSKSINDLTDDSLYEKPSTSTDENALTLQCIENEIDCAAPEVDEELEEKSTGILLNYAKKLTNKNKPVKTVRFSSAPPCVKVMRVWAFAARCARAGHWERFVADRDRFKKRIADVEMAISWVLKPQHRTRVLFQRIRPWLNAQRRKELAEKKAREESERLRMEQEALKNAEEDRQQSSTGLNSEADATEDDSRKNEKEVTDEIKLDPITAVNNESQIGVIQAKEKKMEDFKEVIDNACSSVVRETDCTTKEPSNDLKAILNTAIKTDMTSSKEIVVNTPRSKELYATKKDSLPKKCSSNNSKINNETLENDSEDNIFSISTIDRCIENENKKSCIKIKKSILSKKKNKLNTLNSISECESELNENLRKKGNTVDENSLSTLNPFSKDADLKKEKVLNVNQIVKHKNIEEIPIVAKLDINDSKTHDVQRLNEIRQDEAMRNSPNLSYYGTDFPVQNNLVAKSYTV